MVLALSMDIRTRVAVALEDGDTVRVAARRFGVSVASAVRIGQRQRAGRGQIPGKIGGDRRPVLAGVAGDWRLARRAEKPDLTMRVLTAGIDGGPCHPRRACGPRYRLAVRDARRPERQKKR